MSIEKEVRVRIAPSPTGDPHVGTAYIALFNYVFAKKHNGKFILRIEDTDQTRAKSTSEHQISETLQWLGLAWDEGPGIGGGAGPYRQSERLDIYRKHCQDLVDAGHAYICFCDADRLARVREEQRASGQKTMYDGHCRGLDDAAVKAKLSDCEHHVVRLAMPKEGSIAFEDHLRGEVSIEAREIDDQVILKSDGFPTYHLANVVDDHLMGISHVIRAEEWISSTPKHKMLYHFFGWDEPTWIHLPLLRNKDKSKISKRKNPVSLEYYKRAGFLPAAMINYLAMMGWSFGEDREVFTLDEMIDVFDIKRVSLGGPVFDMDKLTWLNQTYMHKMSTQEFVSHLRNEVFSDAALAKLKPLALERMSKFEDFVDNNNFFFNGALDYSNVSLVPKGKEAGEVRKMLKELVEVLDDVYEWEQSVINDCFKGFREKLGWKPKDFFMTIRFVTTGRKDSPPLLETIECLGREMTRFRFRDAMKSPQLS